MRATHAILVLVMACGDGAVRPGPAGIARFANQAPVWRVNDRTDTPATIKPNRFMRGLYHFDAFYIQATRALEVRRDVRARGVNAFDEVPDSTWFTNRISARDLTPDEIRRGPGSGEAPDQHFPWTVDSAKEGGWSVGFNVTDARGVKFILKFDAAGFPEYETGTDPVVSRLLWAAGYNVPEDHVVHFTRKELQLSPTAWAKIGGHKKKIDTAYLDRQLAKINVGRDGRIRGLATVIIDGKKLGGAVRLGVREDDPNDRIPHELRRDQRGAAALFAWLSHTDIKEDNMFDALQRDPKDPSIEYVVHYLIDFGKALGVQAFTKQQPYPDFQYVFDFAEMGKSLVTLGTHRQPWEGRVNPALPGVGMYSALDFNPGIWKANTFGQLSVVYADRIDKFWGAKIAMKFTRPQIAAAVDAGQFSDPRSVQYLVDTIVERQRAVAAYWFARTNPIDDIKIEGSRLCFTDLALRYGLLRTPTTFTVRAFDAEGKLLNFGATVPAGARGETCVPDFAMARGGSRYTILEVETSRGIPGTMVHVAIDPRTQRPRVIGIYRK